MSRREAYFTQQQINASYFICACGCGERFIQRVGKGRPRKYAHSDHRYRVWLTERKRRQLAHALQTGKNVITKL